MAENNNLQQDDVFEPKAKIKLKKAYEIIDRPEKFAKLFCEVAKNQTLVKDFFKKTIREMLNTDVESRNALKGIIRQVFKEDWKVWIKTVWGKIGLLLWTVITIIIGVLIQKYFGS